MRPFISLHFHYLGKELVKEIENPRNDIRILTH